VLVLCYHAISDSWPDPLAVDAGRLDAQLERLLRRGWHATTFSDAVTAPPAPRTLAVTFDDGFRSVIRFALPVLTRLGIPGTVFVPSAFVDDGRPFAWPQIDRWLGTDHESELEGMSWGELAELRDGGWEIGSHSASHPRLTALADAPLTSELRASKAAIERGVGCRCRSIAYPYADVDARVAAAARAAGYEAGAALLPLRHEGDRLRYPRVPVFATETGVRHRLHVTRTVRRLQATRAWPAVRRAGRRLARES
jgi:peptidoglycan/xylan/chitin deacetylase (PgdA/CDA1 family)